MNASFVRLFWVTVVCLGLFLPVGCEPGKPGSRRSTKKTSPNDSQPKDTGATPADAGKSVLTDVKTPKTTEDKKPDATEEKKPDATEDKKPDTTAKTPEPTETVEVARATTGRKEIELNKGSKTSGAADTIRFAVAWSNNPDAAAAGNEATEAAIKDLGCPAKGVIFYTYYQDPEFVPDEKSQATACKADVKAEQAVAAAVAKTCGDVPNVGCRARCLTNGGTLLKNAVAVLAVGGKKADVVVASVEILDDRLATGKQVAAAMKDVKDLNVIVALAEMRLSFETKEGVSVEDFIRGVLDNSPEDVALLGGNSMPDDMEAAAGMAGAQFIAGKSLKGHVVAMGIGGPIKTFGNHANEFKPSDEAVTVTETKDKWIVTLDDKPAEGIYRKLRGMKPDDELTSDWQHPIGVCVSEGKQYVRMVLNWVDKEGKDKDGKEVDAPPGSLCFVAPVVKGTKIKILCGGDDAPAIVASAKQGVGETLAEAEKAGVTPALCLLSNCCARGMRLRTFREGNDDEVIEAIIPAMKTEIPLFGFYAWGELGRIKGEYRGLKHQYQQHTFVTAVVGIEK